MFGDLLGKDLRKLKECDENLLYLAEECNPRSGKKRGKNLKKKKKRKRRTRIRRRKRSARRRGRGLLKEIEGKWF